MDDGEQTSKVEKMEKEVDIPDEGARYVHSSRFGSECERERVVCGNEWCVARMAWVDVVSR